jgi:hypothetical protein
MVIHRNPINRTPPTYDHSRWPVSRPAGQAGILVGDQADGRHDLARASSMRLYGACRNARHFRVEFVLVCPDLAKRRAGERLAEGAQL